MKTKRGDKRNGQSVVKRRREIKEWKKSGSRKNAS